jgi:hypothetical protein
MSSVASRIAYFSDESCTCMHAEQQHIRANFDDLCYSDSLLLVGYFMGSPLNTAPGMHRQWQGIIFLIE